MNFHFHLFIFPNQNSSLSLIAYFSYYILAPLKPASQNTFPTFPSSLTSNLCNLVNAHNDDYIRKSHNLDTHEVVANLPWVSKEN